MSKRPREDDRSPDTSKEHRDEEQIQVDLDMENENRVDLSKPLLILDIEDLKQDQIKWKIFTLQYLKDYKINNIKVTLNNNLLVYLADDDSYVRMLSAGTIADKQIVEVSTKDKNCVVIKGIDFDNLQYHKEELTGLGVVDLKKIKSHKSNQIVKKVKLICKDEDTVTNLLNNGIKLCYVKYKTEEFKIIPRVIECYHCRALGHIASKCKHLEENPTCPRCGKKDHKKDDNGRMTCDSAVRYCINCKGNHSSAYAKCAEKVNRLNEIKTNLNKNNPTWNKPTYSQITRSIANQPINSNRNNTNEFESITAQIKSFGNIIQEQSNNLNAALNNYHKIDNKLNTINENLTALSRQTEKNTNEIQEIIPKIHKLEIENNDNKTLLTKIATNFIDYYYICNPKSNYDESSIRTLKTFINTFGLNKNESYVAEKLKNIHSNSTKQTSQINAMANSQQTNPITHNPQTNSANNKPQINSLPQKRLTNGTKQT